MVLQRAPLALHLENNIPGNLWSQSTPVIHDWWNHVHYCHKLGVWPYNNYNILPPKPLWQVSICICPHSRLESIAAAAACVDKNQARAQISEKQINKHWRGPAQLMVDRGLPLCLWLSACTALCSSSSQLLQGLKITLTLKPCLNIIFIILSTKRNMTLSKMYIWLYNSYVVLINYIWNDVQLHFFFSSCLLKKCTANK